MSSPLREKMARKAGQFAERLELRAVRGAGRFRAAASNRRARAGNPQGGRVGVSVAARLEGLRVSVRVTVVVPLEPVAVIRSGKVPDMVGVPVMAPEEVLMVRPAGRPAAFEARGQSWLRRFGN